jgi:hypothetical protein
MSADGRAEVSRESRESRDETPMPPMSELLAASAAAQAVCTPPRAPGDDPDDAKREPDAA